MLAFVLASAAAGGISLFSAQLHRTVQEDANSALGADLVLSAPAPLPPALGSLAHRLGLRSTSEVVMPTVAVAGARLKLASLRAVGAPYPLRGDVRLKLRSASGTIRARGIPPRGTVWIAPGLAAALDRRIGEEVTFGSRSFRIRALVAQAPGAELDLVGIAPLAIINLADLLSTGLAGPQARVDYRLLLAGLPGPLARFRTLAKPLLPAGVSFRDSSNLAPAARGPLTETLGFLKLAVLATLLLVAAAVIQSMRQYTANERRNAAILKTLGASRGVIARLYGLEIAWVTLASAGLGTLFAWGIARGLAVLAARWFGLATAAVSPAVLVAAPVTVAVLAAGLWLAPALSLANGRPLQVLRRMPVSPRLTTMVILAASLAVCALVLWLGAENWSLAIWSLGSAAALGAILAAAGFSFLAGVGAAGVGIRPPWRYGTAMLARRRLASLTELVAFGLVLTVVILLTGVRGDLISSWQASLGPNTPDHFILNIQAAQRSGVERFLDRHARGSANLYPMVRARLIAVNGIPVEQWKNRLTRSRARALLEREQTLSSRARLGRGNKIVAGHWWTVRDSGRPLVSAGSNWARDLRLKQGDHLEFSVAGSTLSLSVASLRQIHWRSLEPNFFLVVPPGTLASYPRSWISAVHLGTDEQTVIDLLHHYPNLTVINVNEILGAVSDLLRHAATALAAVFGLALAAAVLVLLATLESSRREREHELALLRVFGARRKQLLAALAAEFGLLGAVSGCAAGLVAAGAGYALARWVFDIPPFFDPWLVLAGALAGIFGIGATGMIATFRLAGKPPLGALRQLR